MCRIGGIHNLEKNAEIEMELSEELQLSDVFPTKPKCFFNHSQENPLNIKVLCDSLMRSLRDRAVVILTRLFCRDKTTLVLFSLSFFFLFTIIGHQFGCRRRILIR